MHDHVIARSAEPLQVAPASSLIRRFEDFLMLPFDAADRPHAKRPPRPLLEPTPVIVADRIDLAAQPMQRATLRPSYFWLLSFSSIRLIIIRYSHFAPPFLARRITALRQIFYGPIPPLR
jgi:hypothetical protein